VTVGIGLKMGRGYPAKVVEVAPLDMDARLGVWALGVQLN